MENHDKLAVMRHSLAHVLAASVKSLWPDVKFAIGPAVANGFYYDFDFGSQKVADKDFAAIEAKMAEIIASGVALEHRELPVAEALAAAEAEGQPYKVELIRDLTVAGETSVSLYRLGDFEDLCRGPHLESVKEIPVGSYKLHKLAGAYWRGDEKNKMLTRIYALAFASAEELTAHLQMLEEAEKRDHRRLGREMDLYSISEKVGPGLILWHPKLAKTREVVESFWRRFHRQRGYDTIYTPHIGRADLWQTSGHLSFFKESMYAPMDIDGDQYFVKPMNCPFHVEIYKSRPRSWRELPFRWNELGSVYRYEKTGELHGMSRVRGFTQDDAHIICRRDQFESEYRNVLKFTFDMFAVFGFTELKGYIAVRDPKTKDQYMGSDEIWTTAEKTIREIVSEFNLPHEVEEGGAKFYGPALDIKAKDSIGREWQLTTIQLDFNLPEKFDMTYTGSNGEERPIMIHRALLGSIERFFSILIEHYAGAFPLWLAPEQVRFIAVGDDHANYCRQLADDFLMQDIRVSVDDANETVGNKIRRASNDKIPYFVVIGDKEKESGQLAVRARGSRETIMFSRDEFLTKLKEGIDKCE
jgi:threonyl-tRNA synthetase